MKLIENNKFGHVLVEGSGTDNKVFFISDTHFGHKNIIKSCERPFGSVEEMDNALIENWNSVVAEDCIIFILGDFCWTHKASTWKNLIDTLNGDKVLIMGNHDDKKIIKALKDDFLIEPRERLTITINGSNKMVLDHFPQYEWSGSRHGTIHLFGHIHQKDSPIARVNSYNVSVERNYYRPISLKEVNNAIEKQKRENKVNLALNDCE